MKNTTKNTHSVPSDEGKNKIPSCASLVNEINDAIFIHKYEENELPGNFIDANQVALDLLECSINELRKLTPLDILASHGPEDFPPLQDDFLKTRRFRMEMVIVSRKGRKIPIEVNARLVDFSGTPYVMTVARDITKQKRVDEQLRQSEERYRNLVNYAPVGIVEIDIENDRLISVNDTICEYSGYTKDELMHIPAAFFFFEDSLKQRKERIAALSLGEKVSEDVEYKLRTKSGKEIWVLFNARYEMEGGKPVRSTGILYDITDRKIAEMKLQESEERLRTILEHMPVMLVAIDESGKLLAWNSECEKITGYKKDKLERSKDIIWRFLYPSQEYRKKVLSFISEQNRYYLNYETTVTCNDGTEKIISWSNISRHFPVPGWYSWVVGFDVTGIRQSENALHRKQDELIAVINNIPDLVWLKNRALQYALINRSLEIFSGVTNEEVSGSSDIACRPADMRDVYLKRDMDVIRTGAMARHEEVLMSCKGQKHIVDCVRMPITNESGAVVGVVGICHDITEQKLREEELQVKLDTMVHTFEEKSDELITVSAELEMRKSELEKERAELESTRQQVQENRNSLSTLATNMENMHRETEHQILMETRKILTPIIQRLKNNKDLDHSKDDINLLASCLEDQTSRFSHNTRIIFSLSPAELQIASMIRNGMSSEEVAAQLHVSVNTIKTHRKNIRRKLGLQNSSVNLTSHLKSHLS